jgi:hypothetical protein
MRTRLALAALAALMLMAAAPPGWTPIESLRYGPPGASSKLTVEQDKSNDDSPRLKILGPNGRTTVITLVGGLITAAAALTETPLNRANLLHSKYFYASDALRDPSGDRLLVVFGAAPDSDPSSIRILHFGPNGRIDTLMANDAFALIAVTDLNHDGKPELVGRASLSQFDKPCVTTYDPLAVYRQSGETYLYDEALSKAYNLSHRYVWAGPTSREDIGVDVCRKAGPRIVAKPGEG